MEKQLYFESNGTKIHGILTIPDGQEKPPVCLLIGGSFPQTRDGNLDNSQTDWFPIPLPPRNLFQDEAQILEKIGIATFRYDKRGCGQSEGDFNTTSLLDLVADANNALQWLSTVSEIDSNRIGILGQSEGAAIALMVTAQNPHLKFYIWQGGIYNNLEDIIRWQATNFWQWDGDAIANFQQQVPLMYWIYKQIDPLIMAAHRGDNFFLLGDENWSKNFFLPAWKQHFDCPPSNFVDKVKCPVLILHGELDHNTPPTEASLMKQALIQSGNTHVTSYIFPGLDHSFRRLGKPDEDFVTAMNRPLASEIPGVLTSWLKRLI
ncbi:alpha/beta hydrolase family protein [Calothrix rhizosoleniae]|uniref:alpha/beta hydrolase family protein n=1 Tax=Calothrix rhizosoleniae TaxID=888997 RepID=UPI000B49E4B5|nr:prolyl oligopeptidase family serine peptidase [Calothrix rhizosoleniae]